MDSYPVRLGAMLFTLVDPHRGHEVAYNRWYERDHFYGGCMIGPGILAGSRWVATRPYKNLRFPADVPTGYGVAEPLDAGSFLATYWIQSGSEAEHFGWSSAQVFDLYAEGRGFDERTHAHTALYMHRRDHYRDPDGVPVELALDHRFGGLVSLHVDRSDDTSADDLDQWFEDEGRALILDDTAVAMMCSWRPIIPKTGEGSSPMELGSGPGTRQRSLQLFFCDEEPSGSWDRFRAYADHLDASGLATVRLAAPFIPTDVGTDRYTDELW
jgi:hypothetical protein